MTTSSILKDVVAYVDVWSSEKTANFAKPFIQQLQEMGAQVSKTLNKQVTHVVYKDGHLATWNKAKKSGVKLVSVLWVSRCREDGVRVDEELYPALNDETKKNKKHRCMQPKDSPTRTPENDRRMKKKLDNLMRLLPPKQTLETEVPSVIIDEENGIVFDKAYKRSEYMEQRLKDMKEKREKLSSTESCSPTGLKPSLCSTPTVCKLKYDMSGDDSSASAAEPTYSPDKEEGRTNVDFTRHDHLDQFKRKDTELPWLSPCRDVPKRIPSPILTCPSIREKDGEEGSKQKKTRRTSVRKKPAETPTVGVLKNPPKDEDSDFNSIQKEKGQIQTRLHDPSLCDSEKAIGKSKAAKSVKETKARNLSDTVNFSNYLSPLATLSDSALKKSKETSPSQKVRKRARQSFTALVRAFTDSTDSKSAASCSTKADDPMFEDCFSPGNRHISKTSVPFHLPEEKHPFFPLHFELDPAPNKRKQRRSESVPSEASCKKKRKLKEDQDGKSHQEPAHTVSEPLIDLQHQGSKGSLPVLNPPASRLQPKDRSQEQSTVTATSGAVKKRRASVSVQPTKLTEATTESELQRKSAASVSSHNPENGGNEPSLAAGSTESSFEGEENPSKKITSDEQKMIGKTKAMRTLVMTSMPSEKQQTVFQVVESLGGFLIVDCVCESTTHVVSGGQRRTVNVLLGIARGCWILSYEWILWSLEQRQWIPEEPYELSGVFPAAQICRLQRHLSAGEHQQDLFEDQPDMFVSQHCQPPTQSLVELIQLCGGRVCKTVRRAGICIGKYSGRRPEGCRIVTEQWVLDCITHMKLLACDKYTLE